MTPADLQAFYDQNFADWVRALNLTVEDTAPEATVMRMPLTDKIARVGGIVSGQALATLADTSMVLAAIVHAGTLRPFSTTNLDTQFLRPGVGTAILARAMVVRAGKALVFARCEMIEESSGKAIAAATATLYAPG